MALNTRAWAGRGLGLVVLLALIGGEATLPGTYLSRRDIFRLHLPLREFVAHEWSQGRLATWNPLDGLGASLPGTAIAAQWHPLQLLLLVLPPDVALKWQVLLCLVLAGLGAALLARRLQGPEATWWLAGVAYATSGYLVSSTDNFTYLHGAALLPWALWAAERLAEKPSRSARCPSARCWRWGFTAATCRARCWPRCWRPRGPWPSPRTAGRPCCSCCWPAWSRRC